MNVGTVGLNVGNIQAYQSAIKGLSGEQAVFALATKGANAAQIEEIMTTETATLAKGTYTQADVQAAMAKHGLATASAILTVAQQKEITNSGLLSAEKMAEMASVLGLTTAENGSLVSKKALNAEMVKQQLESISIVGATQAQIMSILGLATAETGAVAGTNLLTASFAKLWAVISAHPIGAIITAVGALAVGVVSAANASNKAKEEARQTAIELTNTYTQEKDSLDSQIEKYKELKETLDNGNLSTDEARSIKEQLLGIQESLIESYGNEASNIDLVNGKYKEQLGLLSELSKEKATDYVIENRDVFEDAKKALEKERTYNLGRITSWSSYVPQTEDQQALLDFIDSYSELFEITNTGSTSQRGEHFAVRNLQIKANVEDADNIMRQFAIDLEKYGEENDIDVSGMLESISGQLKKTWTDELTEYKTVYDEFMKAEIVRNDTLRPLYQESIQAVEDYNKALSSGEGIEEAKANLDSVQQSVQNATGELEGSQSVFDGIYEGINKDAEAAYNLGKAFENDKTVQNYAEQLRGLTDVDLKAINFDNTNTEKGEEAFKGLMETLGLTEEQVQSLINKLVELGYVQGEVQGSIPPPPMPFTKSDIISAINALTDGFESLDKFYADVSDKEEFDFTLFDDEKFKETFSGFTTEYENFVETISSNNSDISACQKAFDDLLGAWLNSTNIINEVTEDTADLTIAMLENMGVSNARQVVTEALAVKAAKATEAVNNLVGASLEETYAHIDVANGISIEEQALAQLALEKINVNNQQIDTSKDIDAVIGLANAAGSSAKVLGELAKAKSVFAQIEAGTGAGMRFLNDGTYEEMKALVESIENGTYDFDFQIDPNKFKYNGSTQTRKNAGTGSSSSSKEAKKETIDWIERYNEMLQKQHDILEEIANDETQSYNERIGALDEMIAKDKERIDAAQKSAQEYKEAWDKAIEGLSNKDISNIMDGSLDIETYDESVLGEGYIDKLKEAMDLYDKFLEMQEKASDIEEDSLNHMREQLKLEEEIIKAEQELINARQSVTESNLDRIEATGGVVNAGLYRQQIALSKELEETYHDQIDNLAEQIELVDEGSAEYYSLLATMDDCQASIINCQTEQAELNEAIARIPIERLQKYINMLRNIKTDLQNFLDEQSTLGINPTADQLQQLIGLSHEEINSLTEQQKELSKLLANYEYGSEKFNEVQGEIQDIDDEISSLVQNQREWNTQILNIPIENLEKVNDHLSTYSSILSEQIDEQEKAHNAVITYLDKEIEKYEEAKEAVEDKYAPEIEAIQEKIDLLDEESEKMKIIQDLEHAEYGYNKALNNKNIKTINAQGEIEYISDIDALREATVEKQEAELAKLKFDLNESKELLEEQKQKELDALDAEIERVQKIQDVWTKVKEEVESISDILVANNVLGSNWQSIVTAGGTGNENLAHSWSTMYESLMTQKDSVDKQIASNERIIGMMNEFVERFNSGALTYEQVLNGVNELSQNIEKGYTAMEQLSSMMNLDGIKDLSGISSSANTQITDSVDLLRDYLGVANDNNTAINEIAKTWTEMQQSIQDQLAELKRLADELAKKQEQETTIKFESNKHQSDDDDDDYMPSNNTYVLGGPGSSLEEAAEAHANGQKVIVDAHDKEEREALQEYIDSLPRHHSGVSLGTVDKNSSRGKKDNLFQEAAENVLKPTERLVIAKTPEMFITPEQRDNLLKNIGYFNLLPTINKPNLDILSNREIAKNIEVNIGDIVLKGVQDPDGFAKAMKTQFGAILRQEMSKK